MTAHLDIPQSSLPRVVIAGAGFGGLKAAQMLKNKDFQVVLLDRNNYHQFQPLFYQVAMSGLEPASVVFPIRKIFHGSRNTHFRTTEILEVIPQENKLVTSHGELSYDHLLIAMGAGTNYFGNTALEAHAVGMKSVSESVYLRNRILQMLEDAVASGEKGRNTDIVVVGGGPTGVELSGSLAEMKKMMFPRDYPEIDFSMMKIWLVEGSGRLLASMDPKSSEKALKYLTKLGVQVKLNCKTGDIRDNVLSLSDGSSLPHGLMIWAAGVKAFSLKGMPPESIAPNGRIITNNFLQVKGFENIYAIGDQALVEEAAWPKGHPQVAQPAIQGGTLFARNMMNLQKGKALQGFKYKDLGSMATVGRNLAVAELWGLKLGGFLAWAIWMAVHLMSIVGVRNRVFIFMSWVWNYITYDQSLRLLIKPFMKNKGIRD